MNYPDYFALRAVFRAGDSGQSVRNEDRALRAWSRVSQGEANAIMRAWDRRNQTDADRIFFDVDAAREGET